MDHRVKELVNFTRDEWGLENYYLSTFNFYRTLNVINETIYTLNMEWFPSHITHQKDKDYNPKGTAVIELDVNTRQFESVIFVGGKTFANGNVVCNLEVNEIIKFIEKETGLTYGNQFQLQRKEEKEFYFQSCINGVAVSPFGSIEVKFDHEGKMTFFSRNGEFPSKEKVEVETLSIKLNDVEQIAKEQLKLIEFPSSKQKKWIPIYCIDEIYITNDQSKTIPFNNEGLVYKMDERIHWKTSNKKSFKRKQLNLNENTTADQLFSSDPHPDLKPMTDSEKKKCITTIKEFLSRVFSGDSGNWVVKTLHRENGCILATLRVIKHESRVFPRKLTLFIEPKTFKVLNYLDNKSFIETYEEFQESESININIEKAYETIKSMINLKPVYVYDSEKKKFILCGKMDSDFGVNGLDRKIVELNDL